MEPSLKFNRYALPRGSEVCHRCADAINVLEYRIGVHGVLDFLALKLSKARRKQRALRHKFFVADELVHLHTDQLLRRTTSLRLP